MSEVLNLSDTQGFARLYVSLHEYRDVPQPRLRETIYIWYRANIAEYNDMGGEQLDPIDKNDFMEQLEDPKAKPYMTQIQLIKALRTVMWNISLADEYTDALDMVTSFCNMYAQEFENRNGYKYNDSATSYAACEPSLNPQWEPDSDMDYMGVVRRNNIGPKFVYICAPLRGDVLSNIQYASDKAREVFLDGDIPVCPHLLFPPIADVNDAHEDQKAMEMCYQLIGRCDEIRVCGDRITIGMQKEIAYGEAKGIPVHENDRERKRAPKQRKRKHVPCK